MGTGGPRAKSAAVNKRKYSGDSAAAKRDARYGRNLSRNRFNLIVVPA
jgi:hypothetical protein